jgi:hypothetical protein
LKALAIKQKNGKQVEALQSFNDFRRVRKKLFQLNTEAIIEILQENTKESDLNYQD